MEENYLLIDFENVNKIALSELDRTTNILILLGANQKKIGIELVKQAQPFGDKIKWIEIEGSGKNNLDFHLAYFLGKRVSEHNKANFFILSNDTDFDNLIKFVQARKIKCKRINSINEIKEKQNALGKKLKANEKNVGAV